MNQTVAQSFLYRATDSIDSSALFSTITSRVFLGLLVALLAIDVIFLLLHLFEVSGLIPAFISSWITGERLRIDKDRSYSEYYEYIKSVLCIAGLFVCFLRQRRAIYVSLMATYAIVFLDNAFGIHEWFGSVLPFRRGRNEFIAFGIIGLFVGYMLWRTRPTDSPRDMAYAVGCVFFLGMLAFFAMGVDALHTIAWRFSSDLDVVFAMAEDGGELVAISFNLAFVWSVASAIKADGKFHSAT